MRRSHIGVWILVALILAAGVGALIRMSRSHPAAAADDVPVADIRRAEINVEIHATGELDANKTLMVTAPAVGGSALQITYLARTGDRVKKGDVVVEFDPSEQRYKLEQNHSELLQADEEIIKAKADAAVLVAEDKVSLLKAHYGVRRAELDVEKNELVSKIDAQKNDLALVQAKRVLAELEKDIESHRASGQAGVFLAQEKHNKAKLAMDQAQQNLEHMRVTAPMDGLVSIQKNMNASGGFFFTGMSLPDYRPGDQVQAGNAILQVLDPAEMSMVSKVPEEQHDNVKVGEPVKVRFDAIPVTTFDGEVKTVGGMTAGFFFNPDMTHTFDVTIQLSKSDPRLRPGLTAEIIYEGGRTANVACIPRHALFMKEGKRVVYVRKGSSYQQREVRILSQNESHAAIDGLEEGSQVALLDPTVSHKRTGAGLTSADTQGAP